MISRISMAALGLMAFLTGAGMVQATDYTSTQSGDWTSTSTWGGIGWPQNAGDTATIAGGHTVTISTDIPTINNTTITGSAELKMQGSTDSHRTVTAAIVMQNGATLSSYGPHGQTGSTRLYGTIQVSGTANIKIADSQENFEIHSVISGLGDLAIEGTQKNSYQGSLLLYGSNTFTGNVSLASGTYVYVHNANALGLKPNLSVTVISWPTSQSSFAAQLRLMDSAGHFSTNVAEIIVEGTNTYPGTFHQAQGTIVSNKITLVGGKYLFNASGSGTRYFRGELHLQSNTVSTIDRTGSSYGTWRHEGSITGMGSVKVEGGDGNTGNQYFSGTGTCSGGIRIISNSSGDNGRTYCGSDNAFGLGPLWIDGYNGYENALTLSASCTLTNDIRGRGNLVTGNYLLTAVGSLSPRDTGYTTRTEQIGELTIEDLRFGSDTDGCDFYWQYNNTTNDILKTSTLQIGTALHTLYVDWIGTNAAPIGEFPFMTYTGSDPDVGTWNVISSQGYGGRVFLDTENKRLMVRLSTSGTIIFFK